MTARLRGERGAILVHAATALTTFMVVSILVIDHGMVLVSRHQIQTAADAAALAGATALTFDDYDDHSESGPAARAAMAVARSNKVWHEQPAITGADITFPYCPDSLDAGIDASPIPACVQVELYRDASHGNPLPRFIGELLGTAPAGVAARAIAEARAANATDCLKPIAVPDRWNEIVPAIGPWEPGSTFTKWAPANPTVLLSPRDTYVAPTWTQYGTGLRFAFDFGAEVNLTPGTTAIPVSPISPWNYIATQIPGSLFSNDLRSNINQCAKSIVAIGDRLPLAPAGFAPTVESGLEDLVALDPGAQWDAAGRRVTNSCADAHPRCASMSPRIIALAVYDVNDFANHSRFAPGVTDVLVSNIVGFFIASVSGSNATGYLMRHPGLIQSSASLLIDDSTFLRTSLLVQ